MQDSLLYIILALMGVIIYLLVTQHKNKEEPKDSSQELNNLKESINNSFNTMSSSFNSLSKDVTRDMTEALTKVDEKVGNFNKQIEGLSKSSENFTRILSGVKQYGVLAEFSLASLLKDLLLRSTEIFLPNMKGLRFKIEYDSTDYELEGFPYGEKSFKLAFEDVRQPDSKINFGFIYHIFIIK